jgi:hypothetical protein
VELPDSERQLISTSSVSGTYLSPRRSLISPGFPEVVVELPDFRQNQSTLDHTSSQFDLRLAARMPVFTALGTIILAWFGVVLPSMQEVGGSQIADIFPRPPTPSNKATLGKRHRRRHAGSFHPASLWRVNYGAGILQYYF